jgi:hypothetical protein
MIAVLGRWTIGTNPAKRRGRDVILVRRCEVRAAAQPDPDLEKVVGEFIARQILEKDSPLFEG